MEEERRVKKKRRLSKKALKRREMKKRLGSQRVMLFVCFTVIVILFAVTGIIVKDREFSDNENRVLAGKPVFSLPAVLQGSFEADVDSYLADQFPTRDKMISIDFKFKKLLGIKESNNVYVGSDRHLFGKPSVPAEDAVERTEGLIKSFADEYSSKNIYMMLIPDAAVIQSQYLPYGAPVRNQMADIENFEDKTGDVINYLDAASALASVKDEYIYYKTDHHWTSDGAYAVFQKTAADMGISPVEYTSYVVSKKFKGTLSSKSGDYSISDVVKIYSPNSDVRYYVVYTATQEKSTSMYISSKLDEKDHYQLFFGGNHPMVEIHTTANNDRKLLVFKDSYANSYMQFLTPYYETIIMIDPRYYYDNVASVIQSNGITDIMFLYSADTLLTDTALADTLEAAMDKGEEPDYPTATGTDATATDAPSATEGDTE